jgi:hypothetical protein
VIEWNTKFIPTSFKYTLKEWGFLTNFEILKYFVASHFPGFGPYGNHEKEE